MANNSIIDGSNLMFQLAAELVNQSSRNIFLTGKAGTGKTTFLRYVKENCSKQMAIVAPTGVAAINAGGVTIHSFFQLPFTPFIPEGRSSSNEEVVNRNDLLSRLRINKEKRRILQELELLIIDEVSMVRADTMDAIDAVLRHIRKKPLERFGGVQVLMIGDMFQLPPVKNDSTWQLLSEYYESTYFFDSRIIKEDPPLYIEFDKIYRQSEERFIRLLNQVRNNELDEEGHEILESRYLPGFVREKNDGYIILTTHNETARSINSRELESLDGQLFSFRADIKDDFPENVHPAEETLLLKVGAQVMFIKNDSDRSKRYFNGKIGIVTRLEQDKIIVQCKDDKDTIEVKKDSWDNIRYSIDNATGIMKPEVIGSFGQYPLRLAWAITIHKSQGLTFQKAIIDAGKAFASGQVYVALSRCTSLDGMVLQSRITRASLSTDVRILRFAEQCRSSQQLGQELEMARRNYQLKLLTETFDVTKAIGIAAELKDYIIEQDTAFVPGTLSWIDPIINRMRDLQTTAEKFHTWLGLQFIKEIAPEENGLLRTKIKDGSGHFSGEIDQLLDMLRPKSVFTESRQLSKEVNDTIKEIAAELSLKKFLIQTPDGLDTEAWHRRRREFVIPSFSVNVYGGSAKTEIRYPALYQQLKKLRDSICALQDIPVYIVASTKTLEEIAEYLPHTPEELEQISGFGKAKVEKYGEQFLDIVREYSVANGLSSRIADKAPKKQRREKTGVKKPDTRGETYKLYMDGNAIASIAGQRGLAISTIESHLAHYIQRGDIDVQELVSADKIAMIEPLLKDAGDNPMSFIKAKLGDAVSYGDIRLVMASVTYRVNEQHIRE